MLKLSDILVAHKEVGSFDALPPRPGGCLRRRTLLPHGRDAPYPDTPEDWEDRLEAAFSGLIR